MIPLWLAVVAGVTAALTALNAGVFFAFSTFVVPAARRLPPTEAVHAFQAMNRQVPRSLYLPVFLLSGAGGLVTAIAAFAVVGSGVLAFGGLIAFLALVVSIAVNIPRNNALETAGDAEADAAWQRYVGAWAVGNHVRTLLCVLAVGLLVAALVGF